MRTTFEIEPFLGETVPVELVNNVLDCQSAGRSVTLTCELRKVRPLLYNSYGTRYENVFLPLEDAGIATIRLDFCTPEIIRVRFAPGEEVPANTLTATGNTPMVVGEFESPVEVDIQEKDQAIELTTAALRVVLQRQPWQMRIFSRNATGPGQEVLCTRAHQLPTTMPRLDFEFDPSWNFYHRYAYPLGIARRDGEAVQVFDSFDMAHDEHFYGFGESYTHLDHRGRKVDLWIEEAYGNTSAAAYKRIPFFASSRGYGVFINTSFPITAHMGDLTGIAYSLIVHRCLALDYYFIYGPSLKEILPRYTQITGQAGMPPKWTFGHWMSRLTYKSQAEVERVADELRNHRIPTDVIHIDTGWFTEEGNCDLQFDPNRFPDPAVMARRLHEKGFHLSVWQWPNMIIGNSMYEEAKERGFLVKRSDAKVYHQAGYEEDAAVLDYSNPDMVAWLQEKFRDLFRLGIDAIKADFGEGAPVDGLFEKYPSCAMHNLYPLLYNKAIFDVTEEFFGKGEAVVWARSAWAGSQRYPIHWSGDGMAVWADLPCTLRSGLSLGLSGFPFWSHDIGGFVGNATPDLYARWAQLGMFSSHARAHGVPPREPWAYGPQAEEIYRQYAELRYRLLPYIYSQAIEAVSRSLPVLRALVIEFQDDPTVFTIDNQYLFGDSFLVAPIMDETNHRRVYLPMGDWVDYWTKDTVTGGRWLDIEARLEILPIWVRAGAIIPMGPVQQYVDEKPLDPLTLELYVPERQGSCTIYAQDRPPNLIAYTLEQDAERGENLVVTMGPTVGTVELVCYGISVQGASINSTPVAVATHGAGQSIRFDGREGSYIILTVS
jgi:alpha-D-xyloside xylohydrolase